VKTRPRQAFTLLEIMIVVSIMAILGLLGAAAVGRVKDQANRTLILNNLRQLYTAKEFFYSEAGHSQLSSPTALYMKGYLNANTRAQVTAMNSLSANAGWHYHWALRPGLPVLAYRGVLPPNSGPTGEAIWYPDPPTDLAAYFK
jgi:prepilin-type N-terminal cleavage/methylation domain-containing protein